MLHTKANPATGDHGAQEVQVGPALNSQKIESAQVARRPPRDHVRRKRRRLTYNPTSHRLRELERVINARHGKDLDTDDADIYLVPVAQCLRRLHESKDGPATFADLFDRLTIWARVRTPRVAARMLRAAATEAMDNPTMERADALARRLRLPYVAREVLGIRTIGAFDKSKAARTKAAKDNRRRRNRLRIAAKRRARGVKPRAVYLAQSLSRTKPWVAEGLSRATWYRRQVKTPAPGVRQVCRPILFYRQGDRPVSPSTTHTQNSLNLSKVERESWMGWASARPEISFADSVIYLARVPRPWGIGGGDNCKNGATR
jgi:hypothetical protein